jgi:hypothetical protein
VHWRVWKGGQNSPPFPLPPVVLACVPVLFEPVANDVERRYPSRERTSEGEHHDDQDPIVRLRRLAPRHAATRRRRPGVWPVRRHRPGALRVQQGERSRRAGRVEQDSRGLRMVRRKRRTEYDRAVRRRDVLQASPYDRHQRKGRAEDRRPLRLAEVDARHEEPVRRGQA